ncbi:hypothetical protein EV13_2246 [Prochlorococcus sp. MIT 0702]|nr:hypothetical protein EV13_2246 [Prochlorococcus sp. MIT 0702]KGG27179.1 hypothetical protein EV12_1317 [Prochlorococcus sp. MIT 0701]KGG35469.1 hypothetical protein EV14_0855 [Prochlorococcus sp. MIT 0703]
MVLSQHQMPRLVAFPQCNWTFLLDTIKDDLANQNIDLIA